MLASKALIIPCDGTVIRFTDTAKVKFGETGALITADQVRDAWGRLAALQAEGGPIYIRQYAPADGSAPGDITSDTADYVLTDSLITLSDLPTGHRGGEVYVFSTWFAKAASGAVLRVTFQQEQAV